MARVILRNIPSILWLAALACLVFVPGAWAQEAEAATTAPAAEGMLYASWGIFIGLTVVLPIGVFWACSHFIMEDDRLRFAILFYVIVGVLFACATFGLMWAGEFSQDDPVLTGVVSIAVLLIFLVCYFGVASKVYYSGTWRALLFTAVSALIIFTAAYGTMKVTEDLPVGEAFRHHFGADMGLGEAGQAWADAGKRIYGMTMDPVGETLTIDVKGRDEDDAPFASAEADVDAFQPKEKKELKTGFTGKPEESKVDASQVNLTEKPVLKETPQPEEPAPVATINRKPALTPAPENPQEGDDSDYMTPPTKKEKDPEAPAPEPAPVASTFKGGDMVVLRKELTIPTQYGKFKLKTGDKIELISQEESGDWKAKRGMLDFTVAEADIAPVE